MSAIEIIEQIKALPPKERAQVAKYVAEHNDSWEPESFKKGMADAQVGRFLSMYEAFAKWRGRGRLPDGKNTDDYLHLTRDANGG